MTTSESVGVPSALFIPQHPSPPYRPKLTAVMVRAAPKGYTAEHEETGFLAETRFLAELPLAEPP
jgi:hypothetical protein